LIFGPGIGSPSCLVSIGFGSNVSTCEIPPLRNRKITFFALAGKWGGLGASDPPVSAPASTPARPSMPNPFPANLSMSLRVISILLPLIHCTELARAQQCLSVLRPSRIGGLQEVEPDSDFRRSGHAS